MNEMRDAIFTEIRTAMQDGGNLALDSAVRLIGKLIEKYTLSGKPHEAMGASGAMEMVKELRKHTEELYEPSLNAASDEGAK